MLRRDARKRWMKTIWSAASITFFIVLFAGFSPDRSSGRTLFFILFAVGCYSATLEGIRLTADLFAAERRNGTLGLLVLTGLHPVEIFSSKLAGVVMVTGYGLLGGLPFMAIAFLLGGIPFMQFVGAIAVIASLLLFCVAVGVLASVLHRDGGQAQLTAVGIALALTTTPFFVRWASASSGNEWLVWSPGYGAYLVWNDFAGAGANLFWTHITVMIGYVTLALLLGAEVLRRTWRETGEWSEATGWSRWIPGWKRQLDNWGRSIRRELSVDDPFCWLAARRNGPALVAELFVLGGVLLWLAAWFIWETEWMTVGLNVVTSVALHLGLNFAIVYAAARRFGEERLGGGFEILLSTPLSASDLVHSQRRALILQFRRVAGLVLGLDFLLCLGGAVVGDWAPHAVIFYFILWALLIWLYFGWHVRSAMRSMWIAAWTGRPAYAALRSAIPFSFPVGLVLLFPVLPLLLFSFASDAAAGVVLLGMTLVLTTLGFFTSARTLREKLEDELPAIAGSAIPAADEPRFRRWDPEKVVAPSLPILDFATDGFDPPKMDGE